MAISTVLRTIKQIHPKDIIIIQIGTFYHVYGRDSYILSYLFGYKLKPLEKDNWTCGFPADSIAKIKLIDFLLDLSCERKLISQKKLLKLGLKMDDIIKYCTGWLKKIDKNRA